jgi:hypothetical protein
VFTKLKTAAALALAACLLATGLTVYRRDAAHTGQVAPPSQARFRPALRGIDSPVEVRGRVVGPKDQPLAGARLYVGYAVRRHDPEAHVRPTGYPVRATSGADGRFQFTFARSELDARSLDDSRPAVVAVAEGYGPDWVEVGDGPDGTELDLKLVDDFPVNGRLLDQDRRPVAGAKVALCGLISDSRGGVARFLRRDVNAWPPPGSWSGGVPERPPVLTDSDGRFHLAGVGRGRVVVLELQGPGIQPAVLEAATRPPGATPYWGKTRAATFDYVTSPARPVRGAVHDQATGRPLAGASVRVDRSGVVTLTDENGRFDLPGGQNPLGCLVTAGPPTGLPYFTAAACIQHRPGLAPPAVNLDLTRGLPLTGRVTDLATGKPPPAATVEYYPLSSNPLSVAPANRAGPASSTRVQSDGSYRLAVLTGPGLVCVAASPQDSYAGVAVEEKGVGSSAAVLCIERYNALFPISPGEGVGSLTHDFVLRPGRTLQGSVIGLDGHPLAGTKVDGLTATPNTEVLDGSSFTVEGLSPGHARDLFFHHRGKGLGKVVVVRGEDLGPLTVQLEACGVARGRVVDKDGRPVTGLKACFVRGAGIDVMADTDRDGRFRAALVPGQKYSLMLTTQRRLSKNVDEIDVTSGETKDLGDLSLAD